MKIELVKEPTPTPQYRGRWSVWVMLDELEPGDGESFIIASGDDPSEVTREAAIVLTDAVNNLFEQRDRVVPPPART